MLDATGGSGFSSSPFGEAESPPEGWSTSGFSSFGGVEAPSIVIPGIAESSIPTGFGEKAPPKCGSCAMHGEVRAHHTASLMHDELGAGTQGRMERAWTMERDVAEYDNAHGACSGAFK